MTYIVSKAEIDRLGNKIREEGRTLSNETLNDLQAYRTSHRDILSLTFGFLCASSKRIHPTTIVTYRIKRFESIISKLHRYPEMRFSRMWDIGGCRCIARSNNDVYRLKEIISKERDFEIVKEYDYIAYPQKDGYKSLHLFLRHKDCDKIIEVQLRNQVNHNWATLVEITDLLFDSRIKELGDNPDLLRFHYLLSKIETLDIKEKKEIAKIIKQYDYFERLSEVFSRNYIKVRRQWFEIESQNNHKYFLIETTKDDVPKIESFESSIEAENQYFNVYKTSQNANVVLTHLQTPSYNQISIAYSNYILTFHSFLTDCYKILESLFIEALKNGKYIDYFRIFNLYNSLVFNHIKNLVAEVKEIQIYSEQIHNRKSRDKKKEKEWINDINKQVEKANERSKKLGGIFRNSIPSGWLGKFVIRRITKFIENKYRRKIKKVLPKATGAQK